MSTAETINPAVSVTLIAVRVRRDFVLRFLILLPMELIESIYYADPAEWLYASGNLLPFFSLGFKLF